MPSTVLLSPDNAPLRTLTLSRLQLDQDEPVCTVQTQGEELLLYSLIGTVDVCEAVDGDMQAWGTLGTRRTVMEPGPAVLWFPAGSRRLLQIELVDFSADLLLVSTPVLVPNGICMPQRPQVWGHQVGAGTHQREVREVMSPPGCVIHAGETINIAGGWSSWPSHATSEEVVRHAEHEEVFWITTPGYGLMRLDGKYSDGTVAQGIIEVHNNEAIVTPLGSHEIVFSPGAWGVYVWFYTSFLQKTYNKWAHDGVKTYVK